MYDWLNMGEMWVCLFTNQWLSTNTAKPRGNRYCPLYLNRLAGDKTLEVVSQWFYNGSFTWSDWPRPNQHAMVSNKVKHTRNMTVDFLYSIFHCVWTTAWPNCKTSSLNAILRYFHNIDTVLCSDSSTKKYGKWVKLSHSKEVHISNQNEAQFKGDSVHVFVYSGLLGSSNTLHQFWPHTNTLSVKRLKPKFF